VGGLGDCSKKEVQTIAAYQRTKKLFSWGGLGCTLGHIKQEKKKPAAGINWIMKTAELRGKAIGPEKRKERKSA